MIRLKGIIQGGCTGTLVSVALFPVIEIPVWFGLLVVVSWAWLWAYWSVVWSTSSLIGIENRIRHTRQLRDEQRVKDRRNLEVIEETARKRVAQVVRRVLGDFNARWQFDADPDETDLRIHLEHAPDDFNPILDITTVQYALHGYDWREEPEDNPGRCFIVRSISPWEAIKPLYQARRKARLQMEIGAQFLTMDEGNEILNTMLKDALTQTEAQG